MTRYSIIEEACAHYYAHAPRTPLPLPLTHPANALTAHRLYYPTCRVCTHRSGGDRRSPDRMMYACLPPCLPTPHTLHTAPQRRGTYHAAAPTIHFWRLPRHNVRERRGAPPHGLWLIRQRRRQVWVSCCRARAHGVNGLATHRWPGHPGATPHCGVEAASWRIISPTF